jgi:hypothetical protein
LKPENTLKKRRSQFIAALGEMGYPFVIAYGHSFDTCERPVQSYVHGAGRTKQDIYTLIKTLSSAAHENLGPAIEGDQILFTDSCALRSGDRDPWYSDEYRCGDGESGAVQPGIEIEEPCGA